MGVSWASMVNTPLLPMFQKPSSSAVNNNNNTTSHGQTVDPATVKLNDLYGTGNVPRLDGPEKFRRTTKGHMHNNTSGGSTTVNNGVTNNGVYGDFGDLIQYGGRVPSASSGGGSGGSLRNGGGGNWSSAQSPALSNTSGRFGSSDDGSSAMAPASQQQVALAGLGMNVSGFNLGLGSPGLRGMPNGLNMAQLAQLNGMDGINPFNMNILGSAMGRNSSSPRRLLLLEAGLGQHGFVGLGGIGGFAGLQVWVVAALGVVGSVRRQLAGPQRQRQERLIVIRRR